MTLLASRPLTALMLATGGTLMAACAVIHAVVGQ